MNKTYKFFHPISGEEISQEEAVRYAMAISRLPRLVERRCADTGQVYLVNEPSILSTK